RRHRSSDRDWSSDVCSSDLRAEPEQCLAGVAVVARYEGDGRDGGKLAYEPGHRRELVAAAGVDREDERVHPLPPGRPQRVPERRSEERRGGKECGARGGPDS